MLTRRSLLQGLLATAALYPLALRKLEVFADRRMVEFWAYAPMSPLDACPERSPFRPRPAEFIAAELDASEEQLCVEHLKAKYGPGSIVRRFYPDESPTMGPVLASHGYKRQA